MTRPHKCKGAKVTIPTYPTKSLVRLEIMHEHEREVEYFEVDKGKGKRKRENPRVRKPIVQAQQAKPEEEKGKVEP